MKILKITYHILLLSLVAYNTLQLAALQQLVYQGVGIILQVLTGQGQ